MFDKDLTILILVISAKRHKLHCSHTEQLKIKFMDESLKRQKWKNHKLTIKKRDAVKKRRRYPFRKTSEKYYNSLNFYNGEHITLPLVISLVGGSSGISTESPANTYLSGYNKNISTVIKNNLDIFTSRTKQRRILWFSREMTSRNEHSAEMPYW